MLLLRAVLHCRTCVKCMEGWHRCDLAGKRRAETFVLAPNNVRTSKKSKLMFFFGGKCREYHGISLLGEHTTI